MTQQKELKADEMSEEEKKRVAKEYDKAWEEHKCDEVFKHVENCGKCKYKIVLEELEFIDNIIGTGNKDGLVHVDFLFYRIREVNKILKKYD